MNLCSEKKCFGCAVCADTCSQGAITMEIATGFCRPKINEKLCVNCGKCRKICPALNMKKQQLLISDGKCYVAFSSDIDTHYNCASGGFCTELSKQFISSGKYVIGAAWDERKQAVEHKICSIEEDINLISNRSMFKAACMVYIDKLKQADFSNSNKKLHT